MSFWLDPADLWTWASATVLVFERQAKVLILICHEFIDVLVSFGEFDLHNLKSSLEPHVLLCQSVLGYFMLHYVVIEALSLLVDNLWPQFTNLEIDLVCCLIRQLVQLHVRVGVVVHCILFTKLHLRHASRCTGPPLVGAFCISSDHLTTSL